MNVLYKYYSSEFNVESHLQDPSMKLATTKSLNDPFEKDLAKDLAINLAERYMNKNATNTKSKKERVKQYKVISNMLGIISLTETHRNLLMWAHYASSHKGYCIGYKSGFFDNLDVSNLPNTFKKFSPSSQRVIYDSKRFDKDKYSDKLSAFELVTQALRTKSDEWIYEKEHRCIIPFTWADKIITTKASKLLETAINDCKECGLITESCEGEYIFNDSSQTKLTSKNALANIDGTILLKNIDVKFIDSIYLGSECPLNKIQSILSLIKSDPNRYEHIKVYKYEIHENDFAIEPLLLNSKITLDKNTEKRIMIYKL